MLYMEEVILPINAHFIDELLTFMIDETGKMHILRRFVYIRLYFR